MTTKDEALKQAKQATAHKVLIDELLSSITPKTEREHAAAREIEKLREALARLNMTTKDEALKQALDWITKAYVAICRVDDPQFNNLLNLAPVVIEKLSTSVALAQQDSEPVAWMFEYPGKRVAPKFDSAPHGGNWKPLYTTPQSTPAVQQVVAYRYWDADADFGNGAWDYIDGPDDYCDAQPDNFEPLTLLVAPAVPLPAPPAAHAIGAPKEPQRDTTDPDIQTIMLQAEVKE